jgi:hypothetical protein
MGSVYLGKHHVTGAACARQHSCVRLRDAELVDQTLAVAGTKRKSWLGTSGALVEGHVFHHRDSRHVYSLEHLDALYHVDEGQQLRGGDNHGGRYGAVLHETQRDVARP